MSEAQDLRKTLISMEELGHKDQADRITMRLDVYWQTYGEDPVGLPIRANCTLENPGLEPYIRKATATPEEKELFLGDFDKEDVGYIVITNLEGLKLQRNPNAEEREAISRRVVIIDGYEVDPYGMPFIAKAGPMTALKISCPNGPAKIQVAVFPR